MRQMYEAMKKLAEKDPEFAATLSQAEESHQKRIAEEAAESKRKADEAYRAKLAREEKAAKENEQKRREKELEVFATKLPFCYSYCYFGAYSMACGIVFANNATEATEIISSRITSDFLNDGRKTVDDLSTYDREYYDKALKTIRVHQADFSEGVYCCGTYME